MENFRVLRKAWLCLCLVCSLLLSSCAVFRSSNSEKTVSQSKRWKLIITMVPGYDYGNLSVPDDLIRYRTAFNLMRSGSESITTGYVGNFQQMQQLGYELLATGSVLRVALTDQDNKPIIIF